MYCKKMKLPGLFTCRNLNFIPALYLFRYCEIMITNYFLKLYIKNTFKLPGNFW